MIPIKTYKTTVADGKVFIEVQFSAPPLLSQRMRTQSDPATEK